MKKKTLTAPDGTIVRADSIVGVSPLFESIDLGTDAFAVYTTGSTEPFIFAAPLVGEGPKAAKRRKADTATEHQRFIDAWIVSLDGTPFFANN